MNKSTFTPSPLAAATIEDDRTLVFVRYLEHEPQKVWAALTEPTQIAEWAPFTASRELGSTGDATLTMIDGDITEDMPATVRVAEPPRLLEYMWGNDLLRWELTPTATGTRLTLRHTVQDKDWLPKVAAGWHLCLDVADLLLRETPIGVIRGQDAYNYGWQQLHDEYASTLA